MSSALKTVEDYIDDARTLLLDTIQPYRYDDPSLLTAFNVTLLEGRRLRPDLFVVYYPRGVPSFASVDAEEVYIEEQFRLAFVFGLVGHALARDQEDVQDQRSSSFMGVFTSILTGVKPPPIQGSTPPPGAKK